MYMYVHVHVLGMIIYILHIGGVWMIELAPINIFIHLHTYTQYVCI